LFRKGTNKTVNRQKKTQVMKKMEGVENVEDKIDGNRTG